MSNEIKCPHCGEAFTVDESGYAAILNQVRDQEFQREVDARVSLAEKSREQEVALAVTKAEEALRAQIAERRPDCRAGRALQGPGQGFSTGCPEREIGTGEAGGELASAAVLQGRRG